MASSSDPIWTAFRRLDAECLYATFDGDRVVEVVQRVLPGFWDVMFPYQEGGTMKGIWNGGKGVSTDYKPALDGTSALDPALLLRAIVATISSGAAVQFSCTRDFGALVITVLDGNDRHKVYPANAQEIAQAVTDLLDSFTTEPPPQASRTKAR